MKTYEENMADKALVVKSLKVLQKIDGGGITEIKQSVDAIKQQTNLQLKQQEEYWKTLSNDSVISPIEKQTLKREMENVRQSYAAIIQQATALGYTSSILQDYIRTYEALRDYIYTTLKLFDDMTSETKLNDRDYFNSLFSNYFFLESFILLAITKGILDTVNIRVLNSLLEEGTEGETALYHGGLYQYTDGKWKSISTGNYKGAKDELPAAEEDSFFLASETFIFTDVLMVNGEELYVNGDQLGINLLFQKGYIYYVFNGQWKVEADKTNWRYVAAFADVLNVTGELPQIFQDAISDLQDQIDQQQTEIDSKVSHVPVYLGASSAIPSNAQEGDFFTFTGSTYGTWYNSMVYKYENNAWQYLDPDDTGNRNYYMQALTDILACNNASNGFFATIFASSFFANAASIENLSTKTIYLKSGGNIQSEETAYIANQQGLKIDADGNIDANGDTHIGGRCVIDGDTTIEGNAVIRGNVNIEGAMDATNLNIKVTAGDVILRNFGNFVSAPGEDEYNLYSQIIASGTVRVKFNAYRSDNVGHTSDTTGIEIKKENKYGTTLLFSIKSKSILTTETTYSFDVNISEGDYLIFCIIGHGGGLVVVDESVYINELTIRTNASQSILAYLGEWKSESYSSPAR